MCKSCNTVQEYNQGHYSGANKTYPYIIEVGIQCLGCQHIDVAYYTNSRIQAMLRKLNKLKGNIDRSQTDRQAYERQRHKYEKVLKRYQKRVGTMLGGK